MIKINNTNVHDILDFIKPRVGFPEIAELAIVNKQKEWFIKYLIGKELKKSNLPILKSKLELAFYKMLSPPGEAVGIICGQSIGERTTQGTLNTFHAAGLDTGASTQTDGFQSIINATKTSKTGSKKFFQTTLFLKNPSTSLKETKNKCIKYLNKLKMESIINDIKYKNLILEDYEFNFFSIYYGIEYPELENNKYILFSLKLWELFFYRITRNELIEKLSCLGEVLCVPYSMIPESNHSINVYINPIEHIFKTIKQSKEIILTGIAGIHSHIFSQNIDTQEWQIECITTSINEIFMYPEIYDTNKILCSSMYEFFLCYGILATQNLIIKKCMELLPDVAPCHFKLLAIKMTRNGHLEPLTRYTMRNNTSPLTRASFEECFETFLKAGKFKEVEKFKTVSACILAGKKPRIGTYQCDILIDPTFFIN